MRQKLADVDILYTTKRVLYLAKFQLSESGQFALSRGSFWSLRFPGMSNVSEMSSAARSQLDMTPSSASFVLAKYLTKVYDAGNIWLLT